MNTYVIIGDSAKDFYKHGLSIINKTALLPTVLVNVFDKSFLATPLIITLAKRDYINASNADWKIGVVYTEHPRRNKVLIPIEEYNDYILREMVGNIADYIQDNLQVSRLTIGIVSSSKKEAEIAIPVKELNVNAKLNCKLTRNYIVNYEKATKATRRYNYVWIDKFPDVKSAVEHGNKSFEVINETTVELNVGANIAQKIGETLSGKKKMQFYISYTV